MLNALINTAVMGSSALEGKKKFSQAMKNPETSKHDVILKNKPAPIIAPESITNKSASEIIDFLFEKKAEDEDGDYEEEDWSESIKNEGNQIREGSILPKALAAAILTAAVSNAVAHRNILQPYNEMKTVLTAVPKMIWSKAFKGKSGNAIKKGIESAWSKIKKNQGAKTPGGKVYVDITPEQTELMNRERFTRGAWLGAGIGAGNLGIHMLGDKHFENKHTLQKSYDTHLEPVSEVFHERVDKKKDKYTDNRRMHSAGYNGRHLFEKSAAIPGFTNAKHFAKKLVKEDLAQNALRSLPYFAVPAAASYVTGRDLRYDARKINRDGNDKIVIDVPMKDLEKKAGLFKKAPNLHKSMPWKHFFKYEMPAAAARSLSFALPATALTVATGRNMRGTGEKITQADKRPVEKGKARVTIELGHNNRVNDMDPKMASEILGGIFKTAIAVNVKKKRKIDIRTRVKRFMNEKRLNLMTNESVIKNIVRGAMEQKIVSIQYKDAKGMVTTRDTEPYEMRDNKYWGYCRDKNSIRQFNMENVLSATVTENTYAPRWEVKIK